MESVNKLLIKCKKTLVAPILFIILFTFISLSYSHAAETSPGYVPDEILVKFKPGTPAETIRNFNAQQGTRQRSHIPHINVKVLKIPPGRTVEEMIGVYKKNPNVLYAEPNLYKERHFDPNDPQEPSQWYLREPIFGVQGGIDAYDGWDIETGNAIPPIIVAVIDDGFDVNHEDFVHPFFANNPNECDGGGEGITFYCNGTGKENNGIDDDVNGFIDDWRGVDFGCSSPNCQYTSTCTPVPMPTGPPWPDSSCDYDVDVSPGSGDNHGTSTSGLVAAPGNNLIGMAGIAWGGVSVLPLKISNFKGDLTLDAICEAIVYAAGIPPVKILSMSFGGGFSQAEKDAVDYAWNQGKLLLASSGNNNSSVNYPAAYSSVMAIGATNEMDERTTPDDWGGGQGSCYGPELEVVAPGNNTLSADRMGSAGYVDGNYFPGFGGTSASCPIAAGLAALIWSQTPTLTNVEVRNRLKSTADDMVGDPAEDTAGFDIYMGYGRINVQKALTGADSQAPNTVTTLSISGVNGAANSGVATATVQWTGVTDNGTAGMSYYHIKLKVGGTWYDSQNIDSNFSGASCETGANPVNSSGNKTHAPEGTGTHTVGCGGLPDSTAYQFEVIAVDLAGNVATGNAVTGIWTSADRTGPKLSSVTLSDGGGGAGVQAGDKIEFVYNETIQGGTKTSSLTASGTLATLISQLGSFATPGNITASAGTLAVSGNKITITLGGTIGGSAEPDGIFTPVVDSVDDDPDAGVSNLLKDTTGRDTKGSFGPISAPTFSTISASPDPAGIQPVTINVAASEFVYPSTGYAGSFIDTTQAEFNEGTKSNITVTNVSGGEIKIPLAEINIALSSEGGIATTSSNHSASNGTQAAIDGNYNTKWYSNEKDAGTYTVNFGASRSAKRIEWNASTVYAGNRPADFTIQTSPDNSNWTVRDTKSGYSASTYSYTLSPVVNCQYVKINITDVQGVGQAVVGLSEFEAYADLLSISADFVSRAYDTGDPSVKYGDIRWTETLNGGDIEIQVRTASSQSALAGAAWVGPAGTSSTKFTTFGGQAINLVQDGKQWIQYKAYISPDASRTNSPVLSDITIGFNDKSYPNVSVQQNGAPSATDVIMSYTGTPYQYTGAYSVVSGYDGTAKIFATGYNDDNVYGEGQGSFVIDATAPTNPTTVNAWKTSGKVAGEEIPDNTNQQITGNPYFEWSGASDGIGGTGIAGYYVYYGLSANADPETDGTWQTGTSYDVAGADPPPPGIEGVYYLRIKTKDIKGNKSDPVTSFTVIYDVPAGPPPEFTSITASPDPAKQGNATITVVTDVLVYPTSASVGTATDTTNANFSAGTLTDVIVNGDQIESGTQTVTAFSDGFESGNFTTGGWGIDEPGSGVKCKVVISPAACANTYSGGCLLEGGFTTGIRYIYKNVNTTGYISTTIAYKHKGIDGGGAAFGTCSGAYSNTGCSGAFTDFEAALSGAQACSNRGSFGSIAGSDNNPNFCIKLWTNLSAASGNVDDGCLWDAIQVTATGYKNGNFVSRKIDTGNPTILYEEFNFTATVPGAGVLKFQIKTATSSVGLDSAAFVGPDNTTSTYFTASGQAINFAQDYKQWVQYKAYFESPEGRGKIIVQDVSFPYGNDSFPNVAVQQNGYGSEISVDMTKVGDSPPTYTGTYTVFTGYDGIASITANGFNAAKTVFITGTGNFTVDTTAPSNPTAASAWETVSKITSVPDNTTQNDTANPYFEWSGAGDGIWGSGIKGYYYYFGLNAAGAPAIWTTGASYDAGADPGTEGIYYLRVKTEDKAGNQSAPATIFTVVYGTAQGPTFPSITAAPDPTGLQDVTIEVEASEPVYSELLQQPDSATDTTFTGGTASGTQIVYTGDGEIKIDPTNITAITGGEPNETFTGTGVGTNFTMIIKDAGQQISGTGVITQWKIGGFNDGNCALRIFRDDGTNYNYVGGASQSCITAQMNTFSSYILVNAGDLVGGYHIQNIRYNGTGTINYKSGDITTSSLKTGWTNNTSYNIQIKVSGWSLNDGTFVSKVIDTGSEDAVYDKIKWTETLPSGSDIKLQIRTSSTTDFTGINFVGPDNTTGTYFTNPAGENIHSAQDLKRYVQYKAYLYAASNKVDSPILADVTITYFAKPSYPNVTVKQNGAPSPTAVTMAKKIGESRKYTKELIL